MKILLSIIVLISAPLTHVYSQSSANERATFVLVRHAEKVDDSYDPDLSPEGYERAALLAKMIEHIEFDAVYSTPFIRTTETARTVAEKHNVDILEYDHRDPVSVVAAWIEKHKGEFVLVAGHSNSTPTFANALLGREHFKEKFDESDYGNLLIITVSGEGERHLLHMRF